VSKTRAITVYLVDVRPVIGAARGVALVVGGTGGAELGLAPTHAPYFNQTGRLATRFKAAYESQAEELRAQLAEYKTRQAGHNS